MRSHSIFAITLLAKFAVAASLAFAQAGTSRAPVSVASNYTIVDSSTVVPFEPTKAFFVVSDGSHSEKIEAEFIPSFLAESGTQITGELWFAAGVLDISKWQGGFSAMLIFTNKEGKVATGVPQKFRRDAPEFFKGSLDLLKDFIRQRKETLRSVNQLAEARASNALRGVSLELAENELGKVINLEEEKTQLAEQLETIEKDLLNLRELIANARSQANPRSFIRRERELTVALRDLATITREVEGGEWARAATLEEELRRNEHLIEMTRFENVEDLQAELDRVKSRRIRLEQSTKLTEPTITN